MNYYKLNHDGTMIRHQGDLQEKYMGKERGWVRTRLMQKYPYKPTTEKIVLDAIKKIEHPPVKRKKANNGTNKKPTVSDI